MYMRSSMISSSGNDTGISTKPLRRNGSERIEAAGLTDEAKKAADHELNRLERMHPAAAEYNVSRTWLDWLASLPWSEETEDRLDVVEARRWLRSS